MQNLNKKEMNIPEDKKIEILLHALEERYKSIHIIRDRVQNIAIWVLGLFVTAGGWLLQSTSSLSYSSKTELSIGLVSVIFIFHLTYLNDLKKGFKAQQRIQAKIEDILGLCKRNVYGEDSVYPKEWLDAGTKKGKGKFFFHNYMLIYLGTVILTICIWLK
jgi:hypothetical protein